MVDFPDPDNPMTTNISPLMTEIGVVNAHRHAGFFQYGFFVVPLFNKSMAFFGLEPKILYRFFTIIFSIGF